MHLDCQGTGTPIAWIQPILANVTTACGYDRLGYGMFFCHKIDLD
jgi:hypothetical protein